MLTAPPFGRASSYLPSLGELDRALERRPAGYLRLREVEGLASHLPDTGVRLIPQRAHQVGRSREPAREVGVELSTRPRIERAGLEELPVDVELALASGGVFDLDWRGAAVVF